MPMDLTLASLTQSYSNITLHSCHIDIIAMLSQRMRSGGLLRIATDVPDYANHVRNVMDASSGWKLNNLMIHLPCIDGPSYRPVTRYERKAIELSNKIWDFEYIFGQLPT